MLVDITDRKRAEDVQQRFAAIIESSNDAIVSKNLDGVVASWNPGAQRLFGYTAEEMIGKSITIIIPAERHNEDLKFSGASDEANALNITKPFAYAKTEA